MMCVQCGFCESKVVRKGMCVYGRRVEALGVQGCES